MADSHAANPSPLPATRAKSVVDVLVPVAVDTA
jgi:hypothetical protein